MKFTAQQIADLIEGTVEGSGSAEVDHFAKIEEGKQGSLCFLANMSYAHYLYTCSATAVICPSDFKPSQPISSTLIKVDQPYAAFAKLMQMAAAESKKQEGISELAYIDQSSIIGINAFIGPQVVIMSNVLIGAHAQIHPQVYIGNNVKIGDNVTLFPGVRILDDCIIGNNCILHPGVVIGSDGFGFAPDENGIFSKIPQTGNVILEDDVDVGANTTIDRATMGSTIIRQGTKLDNLIQVAHNVEIGKHNVVASQAGFSGSVKVGDHNMIGGQVGIAGHLRIGNFCKIAAQSGIPSDVSDGSTLFGSPAIEASLAKRLFVYYKNLDSLVRRINDLEKKITNKQ